MIAVPAQTLWQLGGDDTVERPLVIKASVGVAVAVCAAAEESDGGYAVLVEMIRAWLD